MRVSTWMALFMFFTAISTIECGERKRARERERAAWAWAVASQQTPVSQEAVTRKISPAEWVYEPPRMLTPSAMDCGPSG